MIRFRKATALFLLLIAMPLFGDKPPFVDITWMSISNIYYEVSGVGIITDGYITRIPQSALAVEAASAILIRPISPMSLRFRACSMPSVARRKLRCCLPDIATSIIPSTRQRGPD